MNHDDDAESTVDESLKGIFTFLFEHSSTYGEIWALRSQNNNDVGFLDLVKRAKKFVSEHVGA